MHCVRKVTDDLYWVGSNDHRLALFENIHPIPQGVSYNAYLLMDEQSVLFDTVDWSACRQLLENLDHVLQGKDLDILLINHMEPDHGASIEEILLRYPKCKVISTEKAFMFMRQFGFDIDGHELIEGSESACLEILPQHCRLSLHTMGAAFCCSYAIRAHRGKRILHRSGQTNKERDSFP